MLIPANGFGDQIPISTQGPVPIKNSGPTIYYQLNTKNQSFLDMHYYLRDIGVQNNLFMLALLDPDLKDVDPHDKNLSPIMKTKVFNEVQRNFWYFAREVVRIPMEGATTADMPRYELHRGNLALNYCFLLNLNIFLELPRQNFKTMSAEVWYLWVFNFATSKSKMGFFHKDHSGSKQNLKELKELREALPDYLKMDKIFSTDQKGPLKKKSTVETLEHLVNGNGIVTFASARTKAAAMTAARGMHVPMLWYDEFAFISHIKIIYDTAVPAISKASENARRFGKPYGTLVTTTPGLLTTDEGIFAYAAKENATKFNERMYDMPLNELYTFLRKNNRSSFMYIKFNYKELGRGEAYISHMAREYGGSWTAFRREILLEWTEVSDKSPFEPAELDLVKRLVKQPIYKIPLMKGQFELEVFEKLDNSAKYPPIMGVDVSGGIKRDSSTITIINSETTRVAAVFNSNFISQGDLARVIYEIVKVWLPNALIVVEENGGFGRAVIAELMKTELRKNLYKELRERVTEERFSGMGKSTKTKSFQYVYGITSNKQLREEMMELLRERMELHKDKFVSQIIYDELAGLEVSARGKVDHSSNTHDDQIISMLLALYVWYYGQDLRSRYGINKKTLQTDQNVEIINEDIGSPQANITEELNTEPDEKISNLQQVLNTMYDKRLTEEQFFQKMRNDDHKAWVDYINSPYGKFDATYGTNGVILVNSEDLQNGRIPQSVFTDFYN
jgi:hypothetical protein